MQNENGYVVTVRGSVEAERLGFCQSHEHLHVSNAWMQAEFPTLCVDDTVQRLIELRAYREAGGRALADVQPMGVGRDAELLRFLSESSDVHIIASTGFHRMAYYPPDHWIFRLEEARLEELFAVELMQGMYLEDDAAEPAKHGCIRAGQIKTALPPGVLDAQHIKLFSAAATAHAMTSAPIAVHVERDADPLLLMDFMEQRGVVPEKMIFCHLDRSVPALSVHETVARRGAYLSYDAIARPGDSDGQRGYGILLHMVEAGFPERLLASPDATRWWPRAGGVQKPGTIRQDMLAAGLSEQALHQIFERNPARAYSMG